MKTAEATTLIRGGIDRSGGVWADLGAGSGTFTLALAGLLGATGTVYAVDQVSTALPGSGPAAGARVISMVADFRGPLALPSLDGVVMANSLHFVEASDQERVLAQVVELLRPGGAFVLVEYDLERGTPWVPYPIEPRRFADLAKAAGLGVPREIGRVRSRFGPRDIYALLTYALR